MQCNRLHDWRSTQSRFANLVSSLITRRWVGLQTLWWFKLKDLSIDEMVGAWCFGCCQAHGGLPFGFVLLWYFVLCNVESLSLLYLHFISCKPNVYVSWSTSELRVRLALLIGFKPSSKIFLLTVPRRYFICGSFLLFMSCVCHAFASVHCCHVVTCWERVDL